MLDEQRREFERFVGKYKAYTYAVAYACSDDFPAAKRMAERVFVEAYRYFDFQFGVSDSRLNRCSEVLDWLRETARRSQGDISDAAWRQIRRKSDADVKSNDVGSEERPHSVSNSAKVRAHRNLLKAVCSLPDEQKVIVLLRCAGGMSREGIAELLRTALERVENALETAAESIGKQLSEGSLQTASSEKSPLNPQSIHRQSTDHPPFKPRSSGGSSQTDNVIDLLHAALSVYSLPVDFTSDVLRKLPEQSVARAERKASYSPRHIYPAGLVSAIFALAIFLLGAPWQTGIYIFLMSLVVAVRIDLRKRRESPAASSFRPGESVDQVKARVKAPPRRRVRLIEPTEVRMIRLTASISIGVGTFILVFGGLVWISWVLTQDHEEAAEWFSTREIYPFMAVCRFWVVLSTSVILAEMARIVTELNPRMKKSSA